MSQDKSSETEGSEGGSTKAAPAGAALSSLQPRRGLGEGTSSRLARRQTRRARVGMASALLLRAEAEGGPEQYGGQDTQADGLTYLSGLPFYAMMRRLAQARWRRQQRLKALEGRATPRLHAFKRRWPGEAISQAGSQTDQGGTPRSSRFPSAHGANIIGESSLVLPSPAQSAPEAAPQANLSDASKPSPGRKPRLDMRRISALIRRAAWDTQARKKLEQEIQQFAPDFQLPTSTPEPAEPLAASPSTRPTSSRPAPINPAPSRPASPKNRVRPLDKLGLQAQHVASPEAARIQHILERTPASHPSASGPAPSRTSTRNTISTAAIASALLQAAQRPATDEQVRELAGELSAPPRVARLTPSRPTPSTPGISQRELDKAERELTRLRQDAPETALSTSSSQEVGSPTARRVAPQGPAPRTQHEARTLARNLRQLGFSGADIQAIFQPSSQPGFQPSLSETPELSSERPRPSLLPRQRRTNPVLPLTTQLSARAELPSQQVPFQSPSPAGPGLTASNPGTPASTPATSILAAAARLDSPSSSAISQTEGPILPRRRSRMVAAEAILPNPAHSAEITPETELSGMAPPVGTPRQTEARDRRAPKRPAPEARPPARTSDTASEAAASRLSGASAPASAHAAQRTLALTPGSVVPKLASRSTGTRPESTSVRDGSETAAPAPQVARLQPSRPLTATQTAAARDSLTPTGRSILPGHRPAPTSLARVLDLPAQILPSAPQNFQDNTQGTTLQSTVYGDPRPVAPVIRPRPDFTGSRTTDLGSQPDTQPSRPRTPTSPIGIARSLARLEQTSHALEEQLSGSKSRAPVATGSLKSTQARALLSILQSATPEAIQQDTPAGEALRQNILARAANFQSAQLQSGTQPRTIAGSTSALSGAVMVQPGNPELAPALSGQTRLPTASAARVTPEVSSLLSRALNDLVMSNTGAARPLSASRARSVITRVKAAYSQDAAVPEVVEQAIALIEANLPARPSRAAARRATPTAPSPAVQALSPLAQPTAPRLRSPSPLFYAQSGAGGPDAGGPDPVDLADSVAHAAARASQPARPGARTQARSLGAPTGTLLVGTQETAQLSGQPGEQPGASQAGTSASPSRRSARRNAAGSGVSAEAGQSGPAQPGVRPTEHAARRSAVALAPQTSRRARPSTPATLIQVGTSALEAQELNMLTGQPESVGETSPAQTSPAQTSPNQPSPAPTKPAPTSPARSRSLRAEPTNTAARRLDSGRAGVSQEPDTQPIGATRRSRRANIDLSGTLQMLASDAPAEPASAPGWVARASTQTEGRSGIGTVDELTRSLARASSVDEVVQVIMSRMDGGISASASSTRALGPAFGELAQSIHQEARTMADQQVEAELAEVRAENQASSRAARSAASRRSRTLAPDQQLLGDAGASSGLSAESGGTRRSRLAAPGAELINDPPRSTARTARQGGRGFSGGAVSASARSIQAGQENRLMKLVRKLQGLIHLAENNRLTDAQRQVRMAEDSASARAEGQAPMGGATSQEGQRKIDIEALGREVTEIVTREIKHRRDRRMEDSDEFWW